MGALTGIVGLKASARLQHVPGPFWAAARELQFSYRYRKPIVHDVSISWHLKLTSLTATPRCVYASYASRMQAGLAKWMD